MTFFYDLNKRLQQVLETPKSEHKQLNEGAHTQDAMKLNPDFKKVGQKPGIMGKIAKGAKRVADFVAPGDEDLLRDLERKSGGKRPMKEAAKPDFLDLDNDKNKKESMKKAAADKKSGARQAFQKQMGGSASDLTKGLSVKKKSAVKESTFEGIDYILSKYPREVEVFKQGGELDYDLESDLWDYYFNRGDIRNYDADASEYIAQRLADELGLNEDAGGEFTAADWKKVVGLKRKLMQADPSREPEDAEQEAVEILGYDYDEVLAWLDSDENLEEADYSAKKARAGKDIGKPGKNFEKIAKSAGERYGSKERGEKVAGAVLAKLRGKNESVEEATKEIPGGRRHTSEPGGYGRKDDEDAPKAVTKKGRGRPKKGSDSETGEVMKPDWSAFGIGGKVNLPKHKGAVTKHKMVGEGEDGDVEAAIKMLKKAGYTVSKDKKELDEKAVSKAQRAAAGIARAAQKGEIPKSELKGASKEMAKMPAGELKKFAKTKEKGLPEKKKKEVEETTVAGSVAPATEAPKKSKGGINFGGSIYDSVNREVENLIAESMNINMSMTNDQHGGPSKSLTVTATDEDADKLAALLQMAGVGAQVPEAEYAEAPYQVDENQPENTPDPVSGDGEMYAGGLNKPKRDVAGDGQATGTVTAVHTTDDDDEELRRIREMAGIRESKKPDFLDLDKDGNKKESMSKAAEEQEDEVKEEKVDESIFASTANLWKTYKG